MVKSEAAPKLSDLSPLGLEAINWLIVVGSLLLCLLILPTRFPGMELMGVGPNWLLIWVVAWSLKRAAWQGAIAGIALGFIQDGLTLAEPTHALSLGVVGILTARLQKQRYLQEDFISVALIVFGMAVVAETITAFQYCLQQIPTDSLGESHSLVKFVVPALADNKIDLSWQVFYTKLSEIWTYHQRIALSSAILSSLWAPVLYYPLNRWWERLTILQKL